MIKYCSVDQLNTRSTSPHSPSSFSLLPLLFNDFQAPSKHPFISANHSAIRFHNPIELPVYLEIRQDLTLGGLPKIDHERPLCLSHASGLTAADSLEVLEAETDLVCECQELNVFISEVLRLELILNFLLPDFQPNPSSRALPGVRPSHVRRQIEHQQIGRVRAELMRRIHLQGIHAFLGLSISALGCEKEMLPGFRDISFGEFEIRVGVLREFS